MMMRRVIVAKYVYLECHKLSFIKFLALSKKRVTHIALGSIHIIKILYTHNKKYVHFGKYQTLFNRTWNIIPPTNNN